MKKRAVEVVVLSDLHLGTYGCHANEIVNYLQSILPQTLILNGDIIDGWSFSKRYFPSSHMRVIKEIMNLASLGTRVVYITGNHDEVLRRYSDLILGNFILVDKFAMNLDGKKVWVFHGDVFDASTQGWARILARIGGHSYNMLILINRCINWFLAIMNKEKMSFSKRVKNSVKKAVKWISDFERTAADLAIENKFDYVICGHIHQPQKRVISNEKGSVIYLNSGDWVENLTSLEYENQRWKIYQYDPEEYKSATKYTRASEPKLEKTVVVPGYVNFSLSTLKDSSI